MCLNACPRTFPIFIHLFLFTVKQEERICLKTDDGATMWVGRRAKAGGFVEYLLFNFIHFVLHLELSAFVFFSKSVSYRGPSD